MENKNYIEIIPDFDDITYKIHYILSDSNYTMYFCKVCKYETSIKQAFNSHLLTKKHANNVLCRLLSKK